MALVTPSRDAQTAESKAWDYHQVKQFLSCRADIKAGFGISPLPPMKISDILIGAFYLKLRTSSMP